MTAKEINFAFEMVSAIALACPEGYTVDRNTFEPIKKGWSVAVEATQKCFGPAGLAKVIAYMNNHPEIPAFGGWYNKKDGNFYFDATMVIEDKQRAIYLGKLNKQDAIYNTETGDTVWL